MGKKHVSWLEIVVIIIALLVGFFFFFYRLGEGSLHPWDEAWYASIARNVLRGDIFDLQFNESPFWDHPPLGFYLIAISFKLFGVSEFSDRLPMALLGLGSLILIILTGRRLKNIWVGVGAALILLSSRWFLLRARTGNLDILLVFTQLLVFFLALRVKTKRQLYMLMFAFSLSLLAKSSISLALLPLVVVALFSFYGSCHFAAPRTEIFSDSNSRRGPRECHPLQKKTAFVVLILFFLPLLPWYGYNTAIYGLDFLKRNLFTIGLRGVSSEGVTMATTQQTLLYFHSAVNKWYTPLFVSIFLSFFFIKKREIRWALAYLFLSAFPYFLSTKTEIWHLIPIIPAASLLIALVGIEIAQNISKIVQPIVVIGFAIISATSLRSYWSEFINREQSVSDAAIIAKTAHGLPEDIVITRSKSDFFPTTVFYADKHVDIFEDMEDKKQLPYLFIGSAEQFHGLSYSIITEQGDIVLARVGPVLLQQR